MLEMLVKNLVVQISVHIIWKSLYWLLNPFETEASVKAMEEEQM